MPSLYFGASDDVIAQLAKTTNETVDNTFAAIYFIYCGDYQATSDRMKVRLGKLGRSGWGLTNTMERVASILQNMYHKLHLISWFKDSIYNHQKNNLAPFFPPTVIGSLDTVPIVVPEGDHRFHQPKYAHAVVKVLFVISNTGFIMQRTKAFTGASHDSTILTHGGIIDKWRDEHQFLADGIFATTTNTIVAKSRPQIWPKNRAHGQTAMNYRCAAHEMLRDNEMQAHFRARVEHTFGSSMFGRFKLFNYYKKSDELLEYALEIAMWVLNVEILLKHGVGGRYDALTENDVARLRVEFDAHEAMGSRYPAPSPLPGEGGATRRRPRLQSIKGKKENEKRKLRISKLSFGQGRRKVHVTTAAFAEADPAAHADEDGEHQP